MKKTKTTPKYIVVFPSEESCFTCVSIEEVEKELEYALGNSTLDGYVIYEIARQVPFEVVPARVKLS